MPFKPDSLPLDIIGETLISGAELAAAFAPVPWLSPAVTVLTNIIKLCQNVPKNKNAANQLCHRCKDVLEILKDDNRYKEPEAIESVRVEINKLLDDIQTKMERWNGMGVLKRFARQGEIAGDIQDSHSEIDGFIVRFNLTASREILAWQSEFAERTKEDREDLMTYLSDWKQKQELGDLARDARDSAMADDVKTVLGMMQNFLTVMTSSDPRHKYLQVNLLTISHAGNELPPDIEISEGLVRRMGDPVAGSSVYDIFEGFYLDDLKCAIKMLRTFDTSEKTRERFSKEARNWRSVYEKDKGKYILPLLGISYVDGPHPSMISRWMRNGNAINYVQLHPDMNRNRMIRGIAEGLKILHEHEPPIAHGNIRGANILISDFGDPLLADFGLSKIMEDITGSPVSEVKGIGDSYRWFAPEVLYGTYRISARSDIYSFAMTTLELMTGDQPFAYVTRTPDMLTRLAKGERPQRPQGQECVKRGLDDKLWELLCDCWVDKPEDRPTIHQVLERLGPKSII